MFVTSAPEVVVPGILNLLDMITHDCLRLPHLSLAQSDVDGKLDLRRQPEFGFTVRMRNVHVYSCFFSREEEQSELSVPYDGWCH